MQGELSQTVKCVWVVSL